jgi:glycosyltransferase involved in cell wall biosynthesis
MPQLTVSVVTPTRNRRSSLHRLLAALSDQERRPDEVIVVDASDDPEREDALAARYPRLRITCMVTTPSVCAQRNAGIQRAGGSHVWLCDDDIEPGPDYLRRLVEHMDGHPTVGAVTGLIEEPGGDGDGVAVGRVPSVRSVLFGFVFQRTVWGDIDAVSGGWLTAGPLAVAKRWFRRRGNTWSLAGWPLITRMDGPALRVAIFGLGAALVRRDWLLGAPYDETLGPHGIGDNYGVALRFPAVPGIAVLTDLSVRHHRSSVNRLDAAATYCRRVLALHYFLHAIPRLADTSSAVLLWSLMGNCLVLARGGEWALLGATVRAMTLIATGRNPLLLPHRRPTTDPLESP